MKSGVYFRFKQFKVAHDRTSHKVGTDGVLLAAWVNVEGVKEILEIGTGSGVMALVLAQRTSPACHIDAVEIEALSAQQAAENFAGSPWPDKIKIKHIPIQRFETDKKYDLIISNPPFFINSSLPPERGRSNARHTGELSFVELVEAALKFLSEEGRLALILPTAEANLFIHQARERSIHCYRRCEVQSRKHKPVERILLEFGLKPRSLLTDNLVIHGLNDEWSKEYVDLTRDFYLKM
jgi:tRNA1Val (adenine37-N6)-methyltransferase